MKQTIKAAAIAFKDKSLEGWSPHVFTASYWKDLIRNWIVTSFIAGVRWERRRVRNG